MAFQGLTAAAGSPGVAMAPVRESVNWHLGCHARKSQPDSPIGCDSSVFSAHICICESIHSLWRRRFRKLDVQRE